MSDLLAILDDCPLLEFARAHTGPWTTGGEENQECLRRAGIEWSALHPTGQALATARWKLIEAAKGANIHAASIVNSFCKRRSESVAQMAPKNP